MKKRQLTDDEKRQMNITKLFHQNRFQEGFNWKNLVISIFLEIIFAISIYYFNDYSLCWVAKIGVVIIPIYIWASINTYNDEKKESKKLLKLIDNIEEQNGIEIIEYQCSKAIFFENYEDEGNCYGLEIEPNKLMFWWDSEYTELGLLPNSKFEVFRNEELELIFGKRLTILGERVQAIKIRPEIKWDNWDIIPDHNVIIASSVNTFLTKIEEKYLIKKEKKRTNTK